MPNNGTTRGSVLVTGAGGGVGSRLVRRLDELGYQVFAGIRSDSQRAALPRSSTVVPLFLDVLDEAGVADAAATVDTATVGAGLQGLVNNAGVLIQGPLELVPAETLRRQFDVNVLGLMNVTRAMLPALRRGQGRIVNVSAPTGRVALPFAGPISASKAAVESLSDALRMELRHQGVEVAVVSPAAMETQIFAKADQYLSDDLTMAPPTQRALYEPALQAVAQAFERTKQLSPDVAVASIVKALTDRSPATRYYAGRDAKMANRVRRLPDRLRDRLLLRVVGVRPQHFTSPTPERTAPSPA